jgi:2-succinyl-6-hydroxy-2,4-cyclohexadiene-1-carboxylate synthase
MTLHFVSEGTGNRRLSFIHGFTQTHRSWIGPASEIDDATRVLIDAPDHGDSQGISLDLQQTGAELANIARDSVLVGYSMGARMALHAIIKHPDAFTGAVLIGATPGLSDVHDRMERIASDEAWATSIERNGTQAFLDSWTTQPLFQFSQFSDADIDDRLRNSPSALASSLRLCGTGQQLPLWDRLPEITIPVLLITGEFDTKFTETAHKMHNLMSNSQIAVINGAGHCAHTDQPEAFAEVVNRWLDSQPNSK